MRRTLFTWTVSIFALGLLLAAGAQAEEGKAEHEYIGVKMCSMCHKKEADGDQAGKWEASSHSKAYETLGTEEAKAVAAKAGLEGNPQELDECLKCHVTAHGVKAELKGKRFSMENGVGCESCHGAGGDYKSKKIMEDPEAARANGLLDPDAELCQTCHNEESPTFKGFDYEKYYAQIAHPIPDSGK